MRAEARHFLEIDATHVGAARRFGRIADQFDGEQHALVCVAATIGHSQSEPQRRQLRWTDASKLVFGCRGGAHAHGLMAQFYFIRTESGLSIGDRVIVSSGMGSRAGILQYVGETKFAPGNWCGVQLDEPTGKNDGTVDGVQYVFPIRPQARWIATRSKCPPVVRLFIRRYFVCPPSYGIFVPMAKVSLSPLARKSRMSRSGSKESLTSFGTVGSITSTNTSRLRMSAQVPLYATYTYTY